MKGICARSEANFAQILRDNSTGAVYLEDLMTMAMTLGQRAG